MINTLYFPELRTMIAADEIAGLREFVGLIAAAKEILCERTVFERE